MADRSDSTKNTPPLNVIYAVLLCLGTGFFTFILLNANAFREIVGRPQEGYAASILVMTVIGSIVVYYLGSIAAHMKSEN